MARLRHLLLLPRQVPPGTEGLIEEFQVLRHRVVALAEEVRVLRESFANAWAELNKHREFVTRPAAASDRQVTKTIKVVRTLATMGRNGKLGPLELSELILDVIAIANTN